MYKVFIKYVSILKVISKVYLKYTTCRAGVTSATFCSQVSTQLGQTTVDCG